MQRQRRLLADVKVFLLAVVWEQFLIELMGLDVKEAVAEQSGGVQQHTLRSDWPDRDTIVFTTKDSLRWEVTVLRLCMRDSSAVA